MTQRPSSATRWSHLRVGDEELVVVSFESPTTRLPPALAARLTPAQQAVARELLRGQSRGAIARSRGRTLSTVSSQIEAIHRRLGVASLAELMVLCAATR